MSDNINQDIAISGEGNIVVGKGDVIINPLPPAEARLRHDLGILLKNVQTTWIRGVLEKSLHEAALLELGMELREEAVDNPWRMILEGPGQVRETLPRGRKIKDVFDESNRLLLILGEPGSGKTTTLLQLARDLIAEVDQTFTQPIPVIFNLSTWIDNRQSLADWLVSELNTKYRTPKKLGERLLIERRIVPLFDGLDEVRAENRALCVEKINRLVVDYGFHGMVVCSRITDYAVLNVRLQFNKAVCLQPLTSEQIDEYFELAGNKLASLRVALHSDEALQNLAQSPLMLNIMSMAYQDTEVLSNRTFDSVETRRRHLFDTYIRKMFKRRGKGDKSYDDHQTIAWLTWLAQKMIDLNQTIFLIEQLQPDWLKTKIQLWIYTLVDRMAGILLFLSVGGSGFWIIPAMVGLAGGQPSDRVFSVRKIWYIVRGALIIGVLGALHYWYGNQRVIDIIGVTDLLTEALIYGGMISALVGGVYFALAGGPTVGPRRIILVETLRWSWSRVMQQQSILGLAAVIAVAIVIGLMTAQIGFGLILGTLAVLMGGVVMGLAGEQVQVKTSPNQGIWRSARHALTVGLSLGLIFTLMYIFLFLGIDTVLQDLQSGDQASVLNLLGWLSPALFISMGCGLVYGGYACISHLILRIILSSKNYLPWNLVHFLDYATERIFLQKVGGGYIFIHRLLMEHFAEMPN